MAKSKKIDIKNVYLVEEDGKLVVRGFEGEEVPFEDLSKEMKELMAQQKPLDIKMKPHSNRKPSEKKPIYKYKCESCQVEIKSKTENLVVKCVNCDCEFVSVEE